MKKYCRACLDRHAINMRRYREERTGGNVCRECGQQRKSDRSKFYCEECLTYHRGWNQTLKMECFAAYGGAICACCGEDELLFLTMDHVNNDGAAHRKKIGGAGLRIYQWLKVNRYPTGFQVLCFNCNQGKYFNGGICPHKMNPQPAQAAAN